MASNPNATEERPLSDIRMGLLADPPAVTDAELLAVVIGQADRNRSSLKNAIRLLEALPGLARRQESFLPEDKVVTAFFCGCQSMTTS